MFDSDGSLKTLIAEKLFPLEGSLAVRLACCGQNIQYAQMNQPDVKTAKKSSVRKILRKTLPLSESRG